MLGLPVGQLIRDARLRSGLTQSAVARLTGLAPSVISKYEMGVREPSATALLKIIHATGGVDAAIDDTSDVNASHEATIACEEPSVSKGVNLDEAAIALRIRVVEHLRAQGFRLTESGALAPVQSDKDRLRALHLEAVNANRARSRNALSRYENRFITRLADGAMIDPTQIKPRLVLVQDRRGQDGLLWRWASLHWSIPVSGGYGRRLRFLVVDEGHGDRLMGLVGLGDPVFSMACRDAAIGWTTEQRRTRLACVMDAFVLGAVPPYDRLLGGKLMALLAGSSEVRKLFAERYGHRTTLIADRDPDAELALITTSSALGRSSVYNRLTRPDGTLALAPVGYTRGTGDFHFSGAIYAELAAFAQSMTPVGATTQRHARWTGDGFRNRREVIQRALDGLGFDSRLLRVHGVRRQVFHNPLATNSCAWLRGETTELDWKKSADAATLSDWWRNRWAVPRSERDRSWRESRASEWSLYSCQDATTEELADDADSRREIDLGR